MHLHIRAGFVDQSRGSADTAALIKLPDTRDPAVRATGKRVPAVSRLTEREIAGVTGLAKHVRRGSIEARLQSLRAVLQRLGGT
jgi:hypothetical protein